MSVFVRLSTENITPNWPQIEELLKPALAIVDTHSPEDVRRMCMANAAQMWVQLDAPIIEAIVVTEFVHYPRGLFCRVWIASANRDNPLDMEQMLDTLEKWRVMHDIKGLEIVGRPGWLRRVPGLNVDGLVMRKVF